MHSNLATLLTLSALALTDLAFSQSVQVLDPSYHRILGVSKSEQIRANMRIVEGALSKQISPPLDNKLTLTDFVHPDYSNQHARMDLSGPVRVKFKVDKRGRTKIIQIVESPGQQLLDSVTDAIEIWQFEPLKRNGEVIEHEFRIDWVFPRAR